MPRKIQAAWVFFAGVVVFAMPLVAQVTIGSDLNVSANGNISAGYNGVYGDVIDSNHGLSFGGSAALNGYYYTPQFLSFNLNPYYNQSRNNSNVGSISDASGVSLSTSIFSGSHFPGSVNYATAFNSTGNYGIPGISSFDTNGNNQTFGVNWGAFLPGWPTLSAGYQMGNSAYSLYGTTDRGSSHFQSFNVTSNYTVAGFGLSGGISHGNSDALIPGIVIGGQDAISNADTTSYVFSAAHQMPWSGTFNSSFNRTSLNSDYLGYTFNGNIDVLTTNLGFHPTSKLSFSISGDYTDNLSGSLYQAIVPGASGATAQAGSGSSNPGTIGIEQAQQQSSHAWNLLSSVSYAFAPNLQAQGQVERRTQSYFGENFGSTLYSAGVSYTRQIIGGYFSTTGNIIDSTVDTGSQNQLGFNVNTAYNRRIGAWQVGGYFNYSQNVQTLLVAYTNSFYNFSGLVSRKLGRFYLTLNAGGGHSGITAQPGTSSGASNVGASVGTSRLNFSGTYAKSNGNSLASGSGLVPTPLPPIIPPELLVLYSGTSYTFTASGEPIRKLTASASYINSRNNLNNLGLASFNNFEQENLYLQYQFRQIGLNGGYTKLRQGFSASGQPPASVSSFYIGVYRWFNFF